MHFGNVADKAVYLETNPTSCKFREFFRTCLILSIEGADLCNDNVTRCHIVGQGLALTYQTMPQ